MQTRGVFLKILHKDCSKIFTNPLRSLLSRTNHHHGGHSEQLSRRLETNILNSTAKRQTTSLNGVPSFVPVSASTTEPSSTSCKGKSDRRCQTTVRPPPVRRAMPRTKIYSAYCPSRRVAQPSLSYGDTLEDGAGHGQQTWAVLREKF